MVCDRLHLICGNCGCNDMWTHEIDYDEEAGHLIVYITCENRGTIHDLDKYSKIEYVEEDEV